MLQTEWPASRKLCPDSIKPFWNEKDNLIEYDGLIFKGQQLVIPTALRPTIMKEVHSGHFGIVKCLERAKAAVYWPGYTLQIRDMVESCSLCQEHRRANSNMPLQQHPVPDHPYQVVGTDLFELDGQVYLLSVDVYSKWVCVEALQETRSIDVIRVLEKQFVDFGCPQRLISDNGPQYGSFEFREFTKRMNFEHVTSSPNYARSNGFSERSVQTVKNSLVKMLSDGKTLEVCCCVGFCPVAVVRGRARSCVRGRSCVVVRGRACAVVRAWSVVRGHSWSCVVVRGRSCAVVPFCGQHCRAARFAASTAVTRTNEGRNEQHTIITP